MEDVAKSHEGPGALPRPVGQAAFVTLIGYLPAYTSMRAAGKGGQNIVWKDRAHTVGTLPGQI